ncbi:hypothetical protein pb186bvf_018557 [Paramecium bursaria]
MDKTIKLNSQAKILIYGGDYCPYCLKVKAIFDKKKKVYEYRNITQKQEYEDERITCQLVGSSYGSNGFHKLKILWWMFRYPRIREKRKTRLIDLMIYIKQLGFGSNAIVWLAQDAQGNQFAVKVFPKVKTSIKSFNNELSILKQLPEGLIKFYGTYEDSKNKYLILEYVETSQFCENVFEKIVDQVNLLHEVGIAHRDIKDENIIFSANPKLIDFGESIQVNGKSNDKCGTKSYQCPQIRQNQPYDPLKADIWSLGILYIRLQIDKFFRWENEKDVQLFLNKQSHDHKNILEGSIL